MKLEVNLDVQYRDLDPLGHVNNAVYLSYFEHARVKLFEDLYKGNVEYNFVLAHAQIDFIKPLYLERIKIISWVSHIGNTSFRIDYEIYNSKNELCAKGYTIQVMFDKNKKEKLKIDENFRNYLLRYQDNF